MIGSWGSELQDRVFVVEEGVHTRSFSNPPWVSNPCSSPWVGGGGDGSTGKSRAGMELLVMRVTHTVLLLQQRQCITSLLSITAGCRAAVKRVANGSGKCPEWENKKMVWRWEWVALGKGESTEAWDAWASQPLHLTPWLKVAPRFLKGFSSSPRGN